MVCSNHNRLVLEINQGCPRGFEFTLLEKIYDSGEDTYKEVPFDLTGRTIEVQVKMAPYIKLPALISKTITQDSDSDLVGLISEPTEGKFVMQFTKEDVDKLPPNDYALIVLLVDSEQSKYHLSGDGNNYAIFRVCYE